MAREGFLIRSGEQFHWINEGYASFDDFLAQLSSRKRKAIRKERDGAMEGRLEFEILSGPEIGEHHWDAFFNFYIDTGNRKWGTPYLNREFFSLLGASLADQLVLFMIQREGRYIAGALNLKSSDCLYGRYWGCLEDHRFLHFETCYYRAIDYAIAHGLKRVEAGAQGPHKLARGYLPTETFSAHWLRDPGFHDAVEDFLRRERREVEAEIHYLAAHSPFRKVNSE
jgi:predicted N-acyltransferase